MLQNRDEVWTEGTHILFRWIKFDEPEQYKQYNKPTTTRIFEIWTRYNGAQLLGTVRWFGRWRKYCFFPAAETVYEEVCLREIAEFCEEATKAHLEALKLKKKKEA